MRYLKRLKWVQNTVKASLPSQIQSLLNVAIMFNLVKILTQLKQFKVSVTPKGNHLLSQRYSELHLDTPSKPLRWLSKKCRWRDLNSQPQRPLPGSIPSLMSQTARFYARLYYHAQTRAHNLLRQKVITYWVSAIVSYILIVSEIKGKRYQFLTVMTFRPQ